MKKLMLLVLLIFGSIKSIGLFGQKMEVYNLFSKAESPTNLSSPSNQRLKSVAKFDLADRTLTDLIQKKPSSFRMSLPRSTGEMVLELHKVQLTDQEFTMVEGGSKLAESLEMGVFYQGKVAGDPNSMVAISCFKDQVSGNIITDNKAFVIGQRNKSISSLYTLEQETPNDVLDGLDYFSCATQDVITPELAKEMAKTNPNQALAPQGVINKVVNIHFECDFDMYIKLGSNPQSLLNYVTSMFNLVHAMYRRESILTRIKSVKYWSSPDPYATKTNTYDALTEFGNQLRAGVPNGANVAHLLSTRSLGGGIAWLDMVCVTPFYSSGNNAYAGPFAVSAINTTFSQLPTFSWTIEVVTHEMGHTLGSPHTQNCSWTGGALDNCYTPEGGCSPGPAPVNGGTIMSYCHLTNYGINFNNGFGTQPGNLIRNRVAAQTCLNNAADAVINVSTNTLNVSNSGGSATVNITTSPTDLFWAASDNASWLNLSLASGTGAAALVVTADANATPNSRSATVTIAAENAVQTINVIQPANNGNVLSISPETASAPNTLGSLTLTLTSNVSWSIASNAAWLTTNLGSGSNSANITANYTANTGAARSGVITITGGGITKTVTINQAAASTLNVSTDLQSVVSTSGSFGFTLTSNISWTITSNSTWLTTNVSSGSNNANITVFYTTNSGASRTAVLAISGGGITKTITIIQAAISSLMVTPTVQTAPNSSGSFGIAVLSNVSWTITSNAAWLTTNATIGKNDGSITASFDANIGASRTGVLTFAGGGITKTVTVNQDAVGSATLTVSPEVQTAASSAGNFSISVLSNVNWTVSSNAGWLTVNPSSGSNSGSVNVGYLANAGIIRTGVLTFSGGGISRTVTINQDAANSFTLSASPATQAAPNTAGSFSIAITSNTSWQISSNAAWLTVNTSSGSNNAALLANYTSNSGDARSGVLTITGGGITRTVTVNQAAAIALTASPNIQNVPSTSGSFSISLTSNVSWTAVSDVSWLSVNQNSGTNSANVIASYLENTGSSGRTGRITFSGGGKSQTVTINQVTSQGCTTPTADQLSVTDISTSQATFNCWISTGVSIYAWRYRLLGSATWISIASTTTNSQIVTGLSSASSYEFQNRLKCVNSSTWTAWSVAVPFNTTSAGLSACVVPNPTQLSASNITAIGARLGCNAASSFGFNWRYRVIGTTNWTNSASTTSFLEIGGLSSDSNYEFQVQKNCGSNNFSSWSTSAIFTTLAAAPSCVAPTISQLSASNITATTARLNTTVTGGSAYNWQYKIAGAANWITLPSTTINFVDLSGLVSASSYEFQVQIDCGSNNLSAWSVSGSFSTTFLLCNASTAQQLSATNVTSSSARLNSSLTGAAGFNWNYRAIGSSTWIAGTSTINGFTDISGLSPSTIYEFQVQTKCSGNQLSAWSESGIFTTSLPPCPAPTVSQLSVTNITSTNARFNTSLTGVLGYIWRFRKVGDANWINPAATTTNSVTISGFSPGTTYEFQVQVNCAANNPSLWSEALSFTTLAAFPSLGGSFVQPIEPSLQLMAYPNPTKGLSLLQIMGGSGENGYLEVVDLQGRVVYKRELTVLPKQTEQVDITSEPNGIYILRLISSKVLITDRLIKE